MSSPYFKGSTVRFQASFSSQGASVAPDTVTLFLWYKVSGVRTAVTYPMPLVDGTYQYDWDSSVADIGSIQYDVKGVSGTLVALNGSSFQLFGRR
jgi:hypothetical protein